jgi:hypothetical protein
MTDQKPTEYDDLREAYEEARRVIRASMTFDYLISTLCRDELRARLVAISDSAGQFLTKYD